MTKLQKEFSVLGGILGVVTCIAFPIVAVVAICGAALVVGVDYRDSK